MFKVVAAKVRAQQLCGVSALFYYYYLGALSLQKGKVGNGN